MVLGLLWLKGDGRRPRTGLAHGLLGATGLSLLLLALQGPRRGEAMGMGSFGSIAAVLFALALTLGPLMPLLSKRTPRAAGVALAAHAVLAITAFVLLLAWVSLDGGVDGRRS